MCTDPLYTVASENDHSRATLEAHTSAEKLVSFPNLFMLFTIINAYKRDVLKVFFVKLSSKFYPIRYSHEELKVITKYITVIIFDVNFTYFTHSARIIVKV